MTYPNHASYSLLYQLLCTCFSTGFDECTVRSDSEYRTFDRKKYDFEGEHSYVLVQTKNLPNYLHNVYIEGINTRVEDDDDDDSHQHGDSSSEEDHSRRVKDEDEDDSDEDDDDDSEEHEDHHRLQGLKIRVYNHTVEFKKKRRLVVSIKGIFNNTLHPSNFPAAPFQQTQYFVHGLILSYFCPPTNICQSAEGNNQHTLIFSLCGVTTAVRQMMCYVLNYALSYVISLLAFYTYL